MPYFASPDSPESNAVYTAVGRTLSEWEMLEWGLANVFVSLIKTRFIGAERAFGAISSSAARMEALRAAADAHFTFEKNDEMQKQFNIFSGEMNRLATKRTHVAHGVVAEYHDGVFLGPAWYSTRHNKLKQPASFRYSAEDINAFAQEFRAQRLAWLRWHEAFSEMQRTSR
jgi:hypothetical protein